MAGERVRRLAVVKHEAREEEEHVGLQRRRKPIVSEARWKMPPDEAG